MSADQDLDNSIASSPMIAGGDKELDDKSIDDLGKHLY